MTYGLRGETAAAAFFGAAFFVAAFLSPVLVAAAAFFVFFLAAGAVCLERVGRAAVARPERVEAGMLMRACWGACCSFGWSKSEGCQRVASDCCRYCTVFPRAFLSPFDTIEPSARLEEGLLLWHISLNTAAGVGCNGIHLRVLMCATGIWKLHATKHGERRTF